MPRTPLLSSAQPTEGCNSCVVLPLHATRNALASSSMYSVGEMDLGLRFNNVRLFHRKNSENLHLISVPRSFYRKDDKYQ